MSENLFAYTATNSGYSQGTAGAINGERAAAATALSAVKNKIENLNGDPAFFNFLIETAAVWFCANIIILLPLNLIRSLTRRLRPGLLWLRL
jgi:hypothetical protein